MDKAPLQRTSGWIHSTTAKECNGVGKFVSIYNDIVQKLNERIAQNPLFEPSQNAHDLLAILELDFLESTKDISEAKIYDIQGLGFCSLDAQIDEQFQTISAPAEQKCEKFIDGLSVIRGCLLKLSDRPEMTERIRIMLEEWKEDGHQLAKEL